jgi:hypothetical protein
VGLAGFLRGVSEAKRISESKSGVEQVNGRGFDSPVA